MNFMEAIKAMKEGKKVRQERWSIDKTSFLLQEYPILFIVIINSGMTFNPEMKKCINRKGNKYKYKP